MVRAEVILLNNTPWSVERLSRLRCHLAAGLLATTVYITSQLVVFGVYIILVEYSDTGIYYIDRVT